MKVSVKSLEDCVLKEGVGGLRHALHVVVEEVPVPSGVLKCTQLISRLYVAVPSVSPANVHNIKKLRFT